jgi:hypothetical protein
MARSRTSHLFNTFIMQRLLFVFVLFMHFIQINEAQVVRRFHQSFDVEELTQLVVHAEGDVKINTWAGNTILVEVLIVTNIGTAAVVNLLQKEGRYELVLESAGDKTAIAHKLHHRQNIKVKGVDMDEAITYTISVPDSFTAEDVQTMRAFTRKL